MTPIYVFNYITFYCDFNKPLFKSYYLNRHIRAFFNTYKNDSGDDNDDDDEIASAHTVINGINISVCLKVLISLHFIYSL
jgi:hypothetical protein